MWLDKVIFILMRMFSVKCCSSLLLLSRLFDCRWTGGPQKYKWASLCTITHSRLSWLVNGCTNKSDFRPQMEVPSVSSQYHWWQTAISHRLCVIMHVTCCLFSMAAPHKWWHVSFFSDRGNKLPALSCSRKFPPKFSGAQLWHPVSIWEIIHEINKSTEKSDRNVHEYIKNIHYLLIQNNQFIQTQINKQTRFGQIKSFFFLY